MKLAFAALALGALLGLILGVPLGRRVERVAWHADATIARARVTGWLIRDLTGGMLTAALVIAVAAFVIWALLRHHD
ncbi:hypothetical protein MCAG_02121 [Micromonospora sp. ATCC 39149]|uniref:Uncharacterized protein n=1 Tax=Micromonospora carbonacea TaxID=47853 RepID=A0A7D6C5G5_9ACTN|nr:hypothetical protein [Micromonospora sp. ATCC 39149]EEP71793.1 hypothetical protein MCAG_02121 [Micromonospora sp. ATCC 39149]QLJ98026.1 hypothetical protein HZU44_25340 [Micromonospora carbonacea]